MSGGAHLASSASWKVSRNLLGGSDSESQLFIYIKEEAVASSAAYLCDEKF